MVSDIQPTAFPQPTNYLSIPVKVKKLFASDSYDSFLSSLISPINNLLVYNTPSSFLEKVSHISQCWTLGAPYRKGIEV
jgi:hypothetical protein